MQGVEFDPKVLAKGLEEIYRGLNVRDEIQNDIFRETLRLFNEAASKGLSDSTWSDDVPDEFINQLRTNNAIWTAFRTHRMQNDIASQLLDENGNLKPFERWVKDIKGMTNHYVRQWLKTEYNTAILRAHQAADWKHFEAEQDVFPNIRWMPTTSPQQDLVHAQYWRNKLTLPLNHPFWKEHRPGDRWNCKCSLEQTDAPTNDEVIKDFKPVAKQAGLENNPGEDGKLFSDSHPYVAKAYPGAKEAVENLMMDYKKISRRQKTEEEKEDIRRRWKERSREYRINGILQIPVGDGSNRKLTEAVADIESKIRMNKNYETAVVFDKDGNIVVDKRGAAREVRFTNGEVKLMKDSVITHNHPSGWKSMPNEITHIGNSFSANDLILAVANDAYEVRAVTPIYTFSMKRPISGWGTTYQNVLSVFMDTNDQVKDELTQAVNLNWITPEQASAIHYHLVSKRIAKKYGWEYVKAKTR